MHKPTKVFFGPISTVLWLIFGILYIMMAGCDGAAPIPAYLKIDEVSVEVGVSEGSSSHNIKNIWLYQNGQSLGAYSIPSEIPILAEGSNEILIQAGVPHNGANGQLVAYPFYKIPSYTLNFTSGQTTELNPAFSYISDAAFDLVADFELSNIFQVSLGTASLMTLTTIDTLVFEGTRSLQVRLSETADTIFEISSILGYPTPANVNVPIYLEMDYRCDAPFIILIKGIDSAGGEQIPDFQQFVNTKKEWNKLYIDLTAAVSQVKAAGYPQYKILMGGSLPDTAQYALFLLDNLKLVR